MELNDLGEDVGYFKIQRELNDQLLEGVFVIHKESDV